MFVPIVLACLSRVGVLDSPVRIKCSDKLCSRPQTVWLLFLLTLGIHAVGQVINKK